MTRKYFHQYFYFLSLLFSAWPMAHASVARMDIAFGDQPATPIYIELFDIQAPVTVTNFLSYIENAGGERRYDGTFFHRSISGFIVQGGGYAYDPAQGAFSTLTAPHIPVDPTIVNEFDSSRSNLRGTITMAKIQNNADSATSEWFFNLANNSANLDFQNGGFTVFGQVLGNGMTTIDSIAVPDTTENLGGFVTLPLYNHSVGTPVLTQNLITITMASSPYAPPLFVNPAPLDYEPVVIGTVSAQQFVTLLNLGDTNLTFGSIASLDSLLPPFSVITDNCSNQTLTSFSTCTLTLEFLPTTAGLIQDSFDIPSDDTNQPTVTFNVSGTGVPPTPVLNVNPAGPIDFQSVAIADFTDRTITVSNSGDNLLQVTGFNIAGSDASDFSVVTASDSCTGASLAFAQSCSTDVRLTANTLGTKSATLTVNAEPNGQSSQISLTGNVILSQADIVAPAPLTRNIGDTQFDIPVTQTVSFSNQGTSDLIITSINITGPDANEFSITNNCPRIAPADRSCSETITFTPSGTGAKSATLEIYSNDPDTSLLSLPIIATSSTDNDGVPDQIEAAGPNNGDANNDGVPDLQQQNITSLLDVNGTYVTLETGAGLRLINVKAGPSPQPGTTPTVGGDANLDFQNGFFSFTVMDVPVGGSATVTLILPTGVSPSTYFKFGWLPAESPLFVQAHWYQFDFDNASGTGAEILDNRVILHLVDGGIGDVDLMTDGRIIDPGGPATLTLPPSASGGGGGCSMAAGDRNAQRPAGLLLLLLGLLARRYFSVPRNPPIKSRN